MNDIFAVLADRHQNELRLHCYRMLGSAHDSDDVVQETLVRAWKAREDLENLVNARAWLYKVATRVCLDELARRKRRALPFEVAPASDPTTVDPNAPWAHEERWVEPCPDLWLAGVANDPSARHEARESLTLAFVAALQHLTPSQRAVLLLRDVVGLSAEETATALDVKLEAANSALHRARTAVKGRLEGRSPAEVAQESAVDPELLARYVRAWHEADVEGFVRLLHDDVKTTMPPAPTWIDGLAANIVFYRPMFEALTRGVTRVIIVPIAANGQTACAFYRAAASGPARLRAVQLLEARAGALSALDHFMLPHLFPLFHLPEEISSSALSAPSG